ncbi:hypothetical protein J437_LFUL006090 [Ladona fulva]|uniref:Zinc transporter ZIP11 n=1 Tax=Ladona fulva TaxID=123851 RepID=A0A8K0NWY3_LADFU|nr:hypothetical protein J437_LFUL006090 [Ladona fulva]
MIQGYSPVIQALLGTFLTWGLTAAGAGMVVIVRGSHRKLLDWSLGFAGGVMLAASYWSLLAPAIEASETQLGFEGGLAFLPAAIGFLTGALFLEVADAILFATTNTKEKHQSPGVLLGKVILASSFQVCGKTAKTDCDNCQRYDEHRETETTTIDGFMEGNISSERIATRRRGIAGRSTKDGEDTAEEGFVQSNAIDSQTLQWRRILLLVVAITVHNIPEGLAVGVGFGAIGKSKSATFESAR